MKFIPFVFIFFGFFQPLTGQAELLRLRLDPGMEYITESHTHTEMMQRVMGIDQDIIIDMDLVTHSKVRDFSDSAYSIEYTYRSLKMQTSSSMYNSVIDTDEGENMESELMRVIIDKPFMLKITPRGIVKEVKGIERLFEDIEEEIDLDSAAMNEFKKSLEGSFGKEAFLQSMQQFFVRFPRQEVVKEAAWTYSYSSSAANMNIRVFNVANLQEINKKELIVRLSGTISTPGKEYVDINGLPGIINLKGESLSEITIDKESGLALETSLSQKLTGNITFKPDRNSDELMSIPTTIILKSTSHSRLP